MDISGLLSRAWKTVWNHKFLIILGMLAALGQGGGGGTGNRFGLDNRGLGGPNGPRIPPNLGAYLADQFQSLGVRGELVAAVVAVLACVIFIFVVALWILRRTSQGGLISAVGTIDSGGTTTFGASFRAGWNKIGRLLVISVVAAIPSLVLFIALIATFIGVAGGSGIDRLYDGNAGRMAAIGQNGGLLIGLASLGCLLFVVTVVMQAIVAFADRACMLEDKGVIESFQRGLEVLGSHFGEALILLLIQVGIGIVLLILLIGPSVAVAICCFLWPILWAIRGSIDAYFSTMWTLAWRGWTGPVSTADAAASPPAAAAA